ncbi:MAG: ABC transporter substrate-binding protein [Anaerolineae bacterium]|nr:ABC transporter substrate-binding protein [Anaerolineae bacterium]
MKRLTRAIVVLMLASILLTACAGAATPAAAPAAEAPAATEAPAAAAAPATEEAAPAAPAAALPAEIAFGAVHDLSGGTALYGTAIQKGINLAVKEINDQKFLGEGVTVKALFEDAAGDPKQAIAAYEKLIANKDVAVILGPTLSTEAKSADPIAQQAQMPVIASSNTVDGIVEIGDYIFRTSLPEASVIPNTVSVTIKSLNLKKVAVMYGNDDAYTQGGYKVFKESLDKEGIEILTEETFAKGDTDFSAQLTKIKSLNPDAIVLSALAEEAANIMVQARTLGIPETIRFIGGNGFNSPKLAEIAGGAAEGAISGSAWNVASTFPTSVKFVEAFKAEYNSDPDQFAAQAYTAAWVAAVAIKNANSVDHKAIRDSLAQIKDFETPLGVFSFNEKRDPVHEPVVLVVKDGAFVVYQP